MKSSCCITIQHKCEGHPHLGAHLGFPEYVSKFVSEKIQQQQQLSKELKLLSTITSTQTQAAFAAYPHGLMGKCSQLTFIVSSIGDNLRQLNDILRTDFIPNLTGCPLPNDIDRKLSAFPARLGSLGICTSLLNSDNNFSASLSVTAPLKWLIYSQYIKYSYQALTDQMLAKANVKKNACASYRLGQPPE